MNHLIFIVAVLAFGMGPLFASVFAIDMSRRPITMIAEKVLASVPFSGGSQVQGSYLSQQQKDDWPKEADDHVIIFVPVLLPIKSNGIPYNPPTILAGNKRFKGHIRNNISLAGTPSSNLKLPKGWDYGNL